MSDDCGSCMGGELSAETAGRWMVHSVSWRQLGGLGTSSPQQLFAASIALGKTLGLFQEQIEVCELFTSCFS